MHIRQKTLATSVVVVAVLAIGIGAYLSTHKSRPQVSDAAYDDPIKTPHQSLVERSQAFVAAAEAEHLDCSMVQHIETLNEQMSQGNPVSVSECLEKQSKDTQGRYADLLLHLETLAEKKAARDFYAAWLSAMQTISPMPGDDRNDAERQNNGTDTLTALGNKLQVEVASP